MLIKSRQASDLTEAHVTPETVYHNRRTLLKALGFGAAGLATLPAQADLIGGLFGKDKPEMAPRKPLKYTAAKPIPSLTMTEEMAAISHNNFYEFGVDKGDPMRNAQNFKVEPWTLKISGAVNKPQTIDVWELINTTALEERIYRFRCVEAWSMVIPWLGFELNTLIKKADPTGNAKYVAFETLYDPKQMPGQASRWMGGGIDYPYVEGLRMDEAMHPLTIMTVGLYGKTLPPQNGAPIRLMAPWKYGFKNIKSIVGIKLVEKMPPTTWNKAAANEYGFYANVNPEVDHPRWSQASERFIEGSTVRRQKTLPFNGYGDQVAGLYAGMDLRKWF